MFLRNLTKFVVNIFFKDAFAVDHKEVGYHHREKQEVVMKKIRSWQDERELENLPEYPNMFDLWLKVNNRLGMYIARKIWAKNDFVILRFVKDFQDFRQLQENIRRFSSFEKSMTIFLVATEDTREKLLSLGVFYVAIYHYDLVGFDPHKKDIILSEFTSYGNRILTLPNNISYLDIELPQEETAQVHTNIYAGRLDGQKSPRLDFLYLDGSFSSHKAMDSLRKCHQNKTEYSNFLSSLTNTRVHENPIKWAWMKPAKVLK